MPDILMSYNSYIKGLSCPTVRWLAILEQRILANTLVTFEGMSKIDSQQLELHPTERRLEQAEHDLPPGHLLHHPGEQLQLLLVVQGQQEECHGEQGGLKM